MGCWVSENEFACAKVMCIATGLLRQALNGSWRCSLICAQLHLLFWYSSGICLPLPILMVLCPAPVAAVGPVKLGTTAFPAALVAQAVAPPKVSTATTEN